MLPESIKKIICLEYITLPMGLCFMSQREKLQLLCKLMEV